MLGVFSGTGTHTIFAVIQAFNVQDHPHKQATNVAVVWKHEPAIDQCESLSLVHGLSAAVHCGCPNMLERHEAVYTRGKAITKISVSFSCTFPQWSYYRFLAEVRFDRLPPAGSWRSCLFDIELGHEFTPGCANKHWVPANNDTFRKTVELSGASSH
ncbi:hypothetical protein EAH_00028610 [Eimeria acervulina]|uniref:Uncharacterized protein n=1 Tax=Eimeria acervulina TaxID=5801 RepID=U6GCH4_EIMAC|nr:hypothetical protein EAH_00028610 [Eimeria acervulina]CDI77971.1 hypothetical protein EAH_00028610 [Eimeria acervulina]